MPTFFSGCWLFVRGTWKRKEMEYENREENLFLKYIFRPAGRRIVGRLASTGITPNQVTVSSFVFGIMAALSFCFGQYVLGSLCIWVSILLDVCDGALARHKNMNTKFGARLDLYLNIFIWFLLPLGLYMGRKTPFHLLLAVWLTISFSYILSKRLFPYTTKNTPKERPLNRFFIKRGLRFGFDEIDMQLMISALAPFLSVTAIFYIIIIGANLDWIYRTVEYKR